MIETITEDYVSFETAKLLKEKGFKGECFAAYNGNGKFYGFDEEINDNDNVPCWSDAPTLQMARKWLRRTHKLYVYPEYLDFLEHGEVWVPKIVDMKTFKEISIENTESSYEQACEEAIKYCLTNLI